MTEQPRLRIPPGVESELSYTQGYVAAQMDCIDRLEGTARSFVVTDEMIDRAYEALKATYVSQADIHDFDVSERMAMRERLRAAIGAALGRSS